MATAKKTATETPRRDTAAKPPVQSSPLHPPDAQPGASPDLKPRRKKDVMVSATVPKQFHLTDDEGTRHTYAAGIQDMPESHARHWYSAANGVEINE